MCELVILKEYLKGIPNNLLIPEDGFNGD